MIKNINISLSLLLVVISLVTAQTNSIKLTGEIVSFVEDNKTQVSIVAYVDSLDELESYQVINNSKGAELKNKNGKHVEATGTVKIDDNDVPWITISSYKFIEVPEEEDDDSFSDTDTLDEAATKNQWND